MQRLSVLTAQLVVQPNQAEKDRTAVAAESEAKRAAHHRTAVIQYTGADAFSATQHALENPTDWTHTTGREDFTTMEVAVARRCHGTHIEVLSRDETPVGSHYLLIHFDVPQLEAAAHRVQVTGMVGQQLSLSVDDIRRRPAFTESVVMECAGNGRMGLKKRFWTHMPWGFEAVGCSRWTGCRLSDLLREAGLTQGAKQVVFTGADKGVQGSEVQYFQRSMSIEEAMLDSVMLCYQMNGTDLAPCHGYPLRLVVPGWYGMASVKWLTNIEVTSGGWTGHQMGAYTYARSDQDPNAIPMRHLMPRALMAPPGHPDFFTRTRVLEPGMHRVLGKAWSGGDGVSRVEFSCDGGRTWTDAVVGGKNGPFGWASWHIDWRAHSGATYALSVRTTNAHGHTQDPINEEQFNAFSMGCTQPQMVYVRVVPSVVPGDKVDLSSETKGAKAKHAAQAPPPLQYMENLYKTGSQ